MAETTTTIDQLAAPFAEHLYARRCSELTIRTFTEGLRLFVAWFEQRHGRLPEMRKLTRTDMADYQQHLRCEPNKRTGHPAKPATIDKRLSALRAYYAYLSEQDESLRGPMDRIKYEKKGAPTQPHALNDKQLARLLSIAYDRIAVADSKRKPKDITPTACEARRDFAIVATLAYAGLRVSELCDLSSDDVDLAPGHAQLVVRRGKGDKYREVELSNEARKALSEWLAWRKHYTAEDGCSAVFVGRRGPMTRNAVGRVVDKLAKLANATGLDADVSPHTLRHTFARRLVDGGAALSDVQELLGHESVVTTSRYTRPSKEQGRVPKLVEIQQGGLVELPPAGEGTEAADEGKKERDHSRPWPGGPRRSTASLDQGTVRRAAAGCPHCLDSADGSGVVDGSGRGDAARGRGACWDAIRPQGGRERCLPLRVESGHDQAWRQALPGPRASVAQRRWGDSTEELRASAQWLEGGPGGAEEGSWRLLVSQLRGRTTGGRGWCFEVDSVA